MTQSSAPLIEIDGVAATVDALAPTLGGYGHFTAMQIRDGRVRGLPFHLARLDGATRELFGASLDGARVRELVRHGLASAERADASVRQSRAGLPHCARTGWDAHSCARDRIE